MTNSDTGPQIPSPADDAALEQQSAAFATNYGRLCDGVAQVIVGHRQAVEMTVVCLLARGHVLLEGVPGLGKTLLVKTLARLLGLRVSRISFTPDLMPADIIGSHILLTDESGNRSMQFQPGPVFGNLILADEINRATPKTQSALLEAMNERTVTVSRTQHELPSPFFVLATQNPIEMEGTYPLPEAQLDRFTMKLEVGHLSGDELMRVIGGHAERTEVAPVCTAAQLQEMQELAGHIAIAPEMLAVAARYLESTQPQSKWAADKVRQYVQYGCSPRAGQHMLACARVVALAGGRAYVAKADIDAVAVPTLAHRLVFNYEGIAAQITAAEIIAGIVAADARDLPR